MPIAGQLSWEAALVAFLAGAASFLSPCVAPLIPGYITYLSGSGTSPEAAADAQQRWYARPALRVSLLFVAGFSVAFVALGFVAAWFGVLLSAYRPVLEAITGIVMILMGAFLLHLLPSAVMDFLYQERKLHPNGRGRWMGKAAPFGLGILFAAGWTPCIGPVLGSILLYAGASASLALGGVLLAIYALGFAVPFLLIGVGWASGLHALGWTRRSGRVVSMVSGVALVLVGIFFLSGQVYTFSIWAQRVMPPLFQ